MLRVHPRLVKSCRHSAAKTVKTFEETPVYGKSLRSDSIRKGYQTENLGPQASVSAEMVRSCLGLGEARGYFGQP